MADPTPLLRTRPVDPTPDVGPRHRGGPLTWLVAISAGLLALGLGMTLWRDGLRAEAVVGLIIAGGIAGQAIWCLVERLRHHRALPRTHGVLVDHLGFRLNFVCRDVAMTAFLLPDASAAGGTTRLLCFLENYASRQREAELTIGPHPQLGLAGAKTVALQLAAGQAAVYVLPLRLAGDLAPGAHDLPITLRMRAVTGAGVLLPGVRRHLHNLWSVHYATPFTVTAETPAGRGGGGDGARVVAVDRAPLPEPCYVSLASVSEPEPRLGGLAELLT